MRLLYVTGESLILDPIISSQVVPLLTEVVLSGYDCTLVTFEPTNSKHRELEVDERLSIVSFRKRNPLINLFVLFFWLIRNARCFDIVHVRSYQPMIAASLFRMLGLGGRLVFDPRGLFADELRYYDGRRLSARVFKWLEKVFLHRADCVVAVSEAMKRYFVGTYEIDPAKVEVIPTFARLASSETPLQVPDIRVAKGWSDKVLLCYSGSMEGWQCFDEIVELFRGASEAIPDFRFVFLTKTPDAMSKKIGHRLPRELYEIFTASPAELPYYLSQCDFGFLLRKLHLINMVAAPIKVKDYLLSGLKIVVTESIGDTTEYISKHSCGSILRFEDVIAGRVDYSSFCQIIPMNEKTRIAQQAGENFSLDISLARHLNLYAKLVSNADEFIVHRKSK